MNEYFENMLSQFIEGKVDFEIDFSNYPKKLYRYRFCDDYNFDSLEMDYLWMVHPSDFNDPFDALVNVDRKDLSNAIEESIINNISEIFTILFSNCKNNDFKNSVTPEEMTTVVESIVKSSNGKYDKNQAIRNMNKYFINLPKNQQEYAESFFNELFESDIFDRYREAFEKLIREIITPTREKFMACCLTKRRDNRKMWENYAENYAGFVIEYSLEPNSDFFQTIRYLFEVEYCDNISPIDFRYLLEIFRKKMIYGEEIDLVAAALPFVKRLLVKSSDYRSEEEWRFISGELKDNKVHFPFATAVYAGYKISDNNLDELKKICKKKNISLYKQKLDNIGGTIIYAPIDVSED